MKISNFVLSKWGKEKKIIYGIEFIPQKTLNKATDNMSVLLIKTLDKNLYYKILFKRTQNFNTLNNEFNFSIKKFKKYMDFLSNFNSLIYEQENKKIKKEFVINSTNKIIVSTLNQNYIKICSFKRNTSIFFILSVDEFYSYIESLDEIYLTRAVVKYLNRNTYIENNLSETDKNKLYKETLKILIDDALDRKDKNAFNILSRELSSICV